MASVLNRTTKQFLGSVNTPDYPDSTWIINPDMSAVSGVNKKYWKITDDNVTEMSQEEKDTVDSDELAQYKVGCKAAIQTAYDNAIRNADLTQKNTADSDVDSATTISDVTQVANTFIGN